MKVSELKHNPNNPRKITEQDQSELELSLGEFGDLSGVIYNIQTKKLVGGHQRTKLFDGSETIHRKKLKEPTRTGTVAEGHIEYKGENFKYREVDWSEEKESAAMIGANKHGGKWDYDILRVNFADLKGINLELTGFDRTELSDLGVKFEPVADINLAPESDFKYAQDTPKTTEQIPTENPNENVKYEDIKEEKSKTMENKRYVIIIDCGSEELKVDMKPKIQSLIEGTECKVF